MKKNIKHYQIIVVNLILLLFCNKVVAGSDYEILILKSSGSNSTQHIQYKNALSSIGLKTKIIYSSEIPQIKVSDNSVLIIPGDAAYSLNKSEIGNVIRLVKNGLGLVTNKHTALAEALGIKFKKNQVRISDISDINHPEIEIKWKDSVFADRFEYEGMGVFCSEAKQQEPVLAGGQLEKGKFLFSTAEFDNVKSFGYGRFPYFHETFCKYFNIRPVIKRNRLVSYLDLGYHDSDSFSCLAKRIKECGINEVHISGWYSVDRFGEEYDTLIQKCHENGILVYLWLELPMVTKEFWDSHPEWREKTALLNDAALDWRKLMALENPECFNAVTSYLDKLIQKYEWDGIDIAEFYFESLEGYKSPDHFTPMSDYVRDEFKVKYGFDPYSIFEKGSKFYYGHNTAAINKFLDYRTELCTRLNKKVLDFFKNNKSDKFLDIYLTQIANPFDEKLNRNIGVEVSDFIKLQKEYGFTMQAEDPYPLWVLGPERYKKIGGTYRNLLGKEPTLTIDINIVDEGRENPFPTSVQTGLEFAELLSVASQNADRVCIYAVNTPYPFDFIYAPFALASGCFAEQVSHGNYATNSPSSFWLDSDSSFSEVYVNNKIWKCFNRNSILIPAGKNKVEVKYGKSNSNTFAVRDISCDKFSFEEQGRNIIISYEENRNVYITLNKRPFEITLNNKKIIPSVYYNSENGEYTVCCPGGNNIMVFDAGF